MAMAAQAQLRLPVGVSSQVRVPRLPWHPLPPPPPLAPHRPLHGALQEQQRRLRLPINSSRALCRSLPLPPGPASAGGHAPSGPLLNPNPLLALPGAAGAPEGRSACPPPLRPSSSSGPRTLTSWASCCASASCSWARS